MSGLKSTRGATRQLVASRIVSLSPIKFEPSTDMDEHVSSKYSALIPLPIHGCDSCRNLVFRIPDTLQDQTSTFQLADVRTYANAGCQFFAGRLRMLDPQQLSHHLKLPLILKIAPTWDESDNETGLHIIRSEWVPNEQSEEYNDEERNEMHVFATHGKFSCNA